MSTRQPRASARTRGLRSALVVPEEGRWDVHVEDVPPDGDCFYHCIATGFPGKTAQQLKQAFADSLTQDIFEAFQAAAEAGMDDYAWFTGIADLAGLKAHARQMGIGGMWAEESAVKRTAQDNDVCLLIYEHGAPKNSRFRHKMGNPLAGHCMILYLDTPPHYIPVSVDGKTLVSVRDL
jgi:hypothetical protein